MPCGILEALGYGLPCIITKGTNLVNDVCEYGAGYDAGENEQSIANAIKCAVEDRNNWEEKSANAVRLIQEKYEWEKVASETINIYKSLGV